jgi:hypothetical protein
MSKILEIDLTIAQHQEAIEHLTAYRKSLESLGSMNGTAVKNGVASAAVKNAVKPTSKATSSSTAKKPRVNSDNELPLREVVWQIMTRKENSKGMKVKDIISVIKDEKTWSTSGDLANMVHGAIFKFKQDGKIERDVENRSYKIV